LVVVVECSLLLLGGLGDGTLLLLLDDFLDNTDGNGLLHVSNGESSEGWVLLESFNAHGLLGNHSNKGGITGLDVLWLFFEDLTRSSIDL
jgi:hypothetical protein